MPADAYEQATIMPPAPGTAVWASFLDGPLIFLAGSLWSAAVLSVCVVRRRHC